jgi:hypothetical protein
MKQLSEEECRVVHTYFEYLDHLNDTKITQNVHFLDDYRAEQTNMFVAACLTIFKLNDLVKEEPEDPFA